MANRLYSLYEVQINGQRRKTYRRISGVALPLAQARRVFQSQLLAPYLLPEHDLRPRCLRPVKESSRG